MTSHVSPLRAVEVAEPHRRAFCGYCGHRPGACSAPGSRVCPKCELGLLLTADEGLAPDSADAFVVLDASLTIRALSKEAEALFDLPETAVVDQPLENLLVAAESSDDARTRLASLLSAAAREPLTSAEPHVAVVRPARAFGVRYRALIGRCEPGRAALVVLSAL